MPDLRQGPEGHRLYGDLMQFPARRLFDRYCVDECRLPASARKVFSSLWQLFWTFSSSRIIVFCVFLALRRMRVKRMWSYTLLIRACTAIATILLASMIHSSITRHLDPKGCEMCYPRRIYTRLADFDTKKSVLLVDIRRTCTEKRSMMRIRGYGREEKTAMER